MINFGYTSRPRNQNVERKMIDNKTVKHKISYAQNNTYFKRIECLIL